MIQRPENFIPSKESSSTSWITWHKALKSAIGKDDANVLFKKAWDQRGTDDANDEELRAYLAKQGITIDKDFTEAVIDVVTSPLDLLSFGKDIGKVMIYGSIVFVFLIMAVIIYFLFNVSKNPGETVGTLAKYAI